MMQLRPAKSVIVVLVVVLAGVISPLYAFASWIAQQLDPLTASEAWLTVWATRLGVPRKLATASIGTVTFTGNGAIPIGTRLRHTSGIIIKTTQAGSTGQSISAIAETTGSLTNLAITETLILETPIAAVAMTVSIVSAFTGGADTELIDVWAARIAEKLQERQKIGDADDYKRWVKESHPAITDAIVYGNTPLLGDITIRVLGTPTQPIVDSATLEAARLVLSRKRNVCGNINLLSVTPQPVSIRIADVAESVHSVITAAIESLFASRTKFDAQLWPEEIERIVALHAQTYTLLAPISKVTAAPGCILTLEDVAWL
jgi:uncharacterized phage protein gp47/JayE